MHDLGTRDHRTATVRLRHTMREHTGLFESRVYACSRAQSHTMGHHTNMWGECTSFFPFPSAISHPSHLHTPRAPRWETSGCERLRAGLTHLGRSVGGISPPLPVRPLQVHRGRANSNLGVPPEIHERVIGSSIWKRLRAFGSNCAIVSKALAVILVQLACQTHPSFIRPGPKRIAKTPCRRLRPGDGELRAPLRRLPRLAVDPLTLSPCKHPNAAG